MAYENTLIKYRFKVLERYVPYDTNEKMESINMPWWITGYSHYSIELRLNIDSAIIICYLPKDKNLFDYWEHAFEIEAEEVDEIIYSDRFPMPSYIKDETATVETNPDTFKEKLDQISTYLKELNIIEKDFIKDEFYHNFETMTISEIKDDLWNLYCFAKDVEYIVNK